MAYNHKQSIAFAALSITILFTACIKKETTPPKPAANNGNQNIITTMAGNGGSGYSGDGGAAIAACLDEPTGLAIDAAGNMYISDKFNNCMRKVNTAGIMTTVAGNATPGFSGDGGAATNAQLNNPYGIAVDTHGNVYITDYKNARVRVLGNSGNITTIAGNGGSGSSGDGGAATAAQLSPIAVAVDDSGTIYIADGDNNRVRKIKNGIISTFAGNGNANFGGDGGLADTSALYYPSGLTCDHIGNVYIADYSNNRIRKVNSAGIITTVAGNSIGGYAGDGGAATAAELAYPSDVVIDASGNFYIVDSFNGYVRMVNTNGIISTYAGNGSQKYSGDGGPATAAGLDSPWGIAINSNGNIHVTDYTNRVRAISVQ